MCARLRGDKNYIILFVVFGVYGSFLKKKYDAIIIRTLTVVALKKENL